MINKNSDNESVRDRLIKCTFWDKLFANEYVLSSKEVKFSEQAFSVRKAVSVIKYHQSIFQNNNLFDIFNNWLNYILAYYFANFEKTKGNVNIFLSNLIIPLFITKYHIKLLTNRLINF